MSKKGYIYTAIVVAIIVIIGGAHLWSSHSQTASKNHVQTINVAGVADNHPYTYTDGNKIGGYDGALFRKLDKDLPQYHFHYSTTSQNSVFVGLSSGKYDLASSGFWYSNQRAKKYLFSNPTAVADLRLVHRQNNKINSLSGLARKKQTLAPISSDDARYSFIAKYNHDHPSHKVNLKPIGDISSGDALKQLKQKDFDAVFYPYQAYFGVKRAGGAKGLTVTKTIGVKNDYMMADKNAKDKKLIKAINKDLKHLKKDGYLDKLSKKYLGEDVFKVPGAEKNFQNDKG